MTCPLTTIIRADYRLQTADELRALLAAPVGADATEWARHATTLDTTNLLDAIEAADAGNPVWMAQDEDGLAFAPFNATGMRARISEAENAADEFEGGVVCELENCLAQAGLPINAEMLETVIFNADAERHSPAWRAHLATLRSFGANAHCAEDCPCGEVSSPVDVDALMLDIAQTACEICTALGYNAEIHVTEAGCSVHLQ